MVSISDLIYDDGHGRGCECEKQIRGAFPNATIEPVWDDVHGKRIQVEVDSSLADWFEFLIRSGLYRASFNFRISIHERESGEVIMAIAKRLKMEKEAEDDRPS